MARQSRGTDGWPTILWITWKWGRSSAGSPCVRLHREQIFERYPESAHGQGRSGDQCCMCRAQPPRQEPELFDVSSAERGRLAGEQGARTPGSSPVSP
jgi:hypothetical protein